MKKGVRRAISAFIALSLVALVLMVIVYYSAKSGLGVKFTEEGDIGIQIDNIHYSNTRAGRVEWELDAKSATRFKKEDLMVFDAVKMVFYAKDGTPYRLKAREGRYLETRGEINARGDVEITSPGGYNLKTESIKYLSGPGELTSSDHVRILSESMDVEGVGLKVDIDDGRFYILKDVRAVLKDEAI
ncbi:MAG: hypothetical protein BMS9Abin23_0631 [Thermodesulfobacteriota bacterium]|nr:MAG: hypothetical protein BMS9Abin23_0631 [Thermodesulfobacteriota bacterium]